MVESKTWIVDINGLADVLSCSKSTVLKKWREYPHFFIGKRNSARSARFDVNDVLNFLKQRDYIHNTGGIISRVKEGPNTVHSKKIYKYNALSDRRIPPIEEDQFNLCRHLRTDHENKVWAEYWNNNSKQPLKKRK